MSHTVLRTLPEFKVQTTDYWGGMIYKYVVHPDFKYMNCLWLNLLAQTEFTKVPQLIMSYGSYLSSLSEYLLVN